MKKSTWMWVIGAVVVIGGLIVLGRFTTKPKLGMTVSDPSTLPGIQAGTTTPWDVELTNLKSRLDADSLPALAAEGTVLHIHQHLDLYIHGQPVQIPAGIGIYEAAQFISPIHVHDFTGIIHVESPTQQSFTLGQFFDIWGVKFTQNCIGGYCDDASNTLKAFVGGKPYDGDLRKLELTAHEEIAITYGTDAEIPQAIPQAYTFPPGY